MLLATTSFFGKSASTFCTAKHHLITFNSNENHCQSHSGARKKCKIRHGMKYHRDDRECQAAHQPNRIPRPRNSFEIVIVNRANASATGGARRNFKATQRMHLDQVGKLAAGVFVCISYLVSLALAFWYGMPVELQIPVEAANVHAARVTPMVFHCCVIDDIDDRTHDGR